MSDTNDGRIQRIIDRARALGLPLGPISEPVTWVKGSKRGGHVLHTAGYSRCPTSRLPLATYGTPVTLSLLEVIKGRCCDCIGSIFYFPEALTRHLFRLEALVTVDRAFNRLTADPRTPRWGVLAEARQALSYDTDTDDAKGLADIADRYRQRLHGLGDTVDDWRRRPHDSLRMWAAYLQLRRVGGHVPTDETTWWTHLHQDGVLVDYPRPERLAEMDASHVSRWNSHLDRFADAFDGAASQLVLRNLPEGWSGANASGNLMPTARAQFALASDDTMSVLDVVPGVVVDVLETQNRPHVFNVHGQPLTRPQAEVLLGLWHKPGGFTDFDQAVTVARLCT